MFESSKFDKSGLKSGGHIRPGPDLKKGRIPAGAGYDIWCNPNMNTRALYWRANWAVPGSSGNGHAKTGIPY